jgi:hypothetical protein
MLNIKEANITENHQQVPTNDQQSSTVNIPNPGEKKKVTSERWVEANRRNALRSTGPRNTERTRRNATRHGLLAEGFGLFFSPLSLYGKDIDRGAKKRGIGWGRAWGETCR